MKNLKLLFLAFVVSQPVWALYSTMTNGDILKPGRYDITAESQFVTSGESGINFLGRVETGFRPDSNLRFELGFGATDFHTAGYYVWSPIPDVDNQPALGVMGGLSFAKFDDEDIIGLRAHPFASKKFKHDWGVFDAYAALPIGIDFGDDDTLTPVHLALGTFYKPTEFKNIEFIGEVGFNIKDAFTYLSAAVKFSLDDDNNLRLD